MPKLADSMFVTGINEQLAVVDVYGQDGQAVLNGVSAVDTFSEYYQELQPEAPPDIPEETLSDFTGPLPDVTLTPSIIEDNSFASDLNISSSVAGMSSDMKGSLLSSSGNIVSSLQVGVNGFSSTVSSLSGANARGLINTVANISGETIPFSVNDVATKALVATNAINQATRAGMSGLFSVVAKSSQLAGNPLGTIAKGISSTIISTSNIPVLGEVSSFPTAAQAINLSKPTFASDFLSTYTQASNNINNIQKSLSGQYSQVRGALNQINKNWQTTQRNVKTVLSAQNLKNASKNAVNMIKANANNAAKVAAVGLSAMAVSAVVNKLKTAPVPTTETFMLPAIGLPNSNTNSSLLAENPALSVMGLA